MRSYEQYCAIAKALDVIGDRWVLLIVRELMTSGPSRYTDLLKGLPGIATNLLADRLREMEKAGIVRREEAPPPVATTLFHLTERGKALKPVLEELGRWGSPLLGVPQPSNVFRSHWLVFPFDAYLTDNSPNEPPIAVEVRTGDEPMVVETVEGKVRTRRGEVKSPDAVLTGRPGLILGLLSGRFDLAEAKSRGLELSGSEKAVARIAGRWGAEGPKS
ncbi:MAG TPA: helix-turn-helix domain-containing protein [Candidatus Dormibacteraeota bacterium]|nr:helix-turn-helix domain-containing protein [Candidatus Dormibacteraeota bacterium]